MRDVVSLLPILAVAALLWLLLVRPQVRRQRERQRELVDLQQSLEIGDQVMLTSGIHGTLRELHDDGPGEARSDEESTVGVEIADGVTIRVARGAIGRVLHVVPDGPAGATDPAEEA